MDGDAVEVGRPEVVEGLYGDGVSVAFVQGDGYHFPSHSLGVPRGGAVAVVSENDGVAYLLFVDEELGGSSVARDVVDGDWL